MNQLSGSAKPLRVVHVDSIEHYRAPFYEGVRTTLAREGIRYDVITGTPDGKMLAKGDQVELPWQTTRTYRHLGVGPLSAVWQPILQDIWASDLAILVQENRRLVNFAAQTLRHAHATRIALWGHGRNYQAASGFSPTEIWKRYWATRCDWWFTYTEQTKELIESYRFPADRITVFDNTVDTSQLTQWDAEIGQDELESLRRTWGLASKQTGVYVGGLYDQKRLTFLIEAAKEIRSRIPSFELVIVGSGCDRPLVEAAVSDHPWLHYCGPRFGREKAALIKLGKVFLMPGLVGLAVLDCSALGVPLITTNYPFHSPEIAYIESGKNGLIVDDWEDVRFYADTVVEVLSDNNLQARLAEGARVLAKTHTMENMVERFCDGVLTCLRSDKRVGT